MFGNRMSDAAAAALLAAADAGGRIFGFENIQRHLRSQKRDHAKGAAGSIAQANRWTGKPHEHRREIARRARQEAARATA
jgi:hypothetical protein